MVNAIWSAALHSLQAVEGALQRPGSYIIYKKNKYIYFIPFKTHTLYLPSVSSCPTESCSIGRNLRILAKAGRF